ncbi:MAG: Phosphate metabolism transcription protein [Sclerophora amabilis]|nr:MAG: Phosphate metabolism transcription protein [Sclerophora amabilis]
MPSSINPVLAESNGTPVNFDDALEDLELALQGPPRQRKAKVTKVVDGLCQHAYENALSRNALASLIEILSRSTKLDQASAGQLIRNLYPAGKVDNSVVIKVVGCLGQGVNKPSSQVQAQLLKWLVLIYDHLENPNTLSRLYGTLFNLLETISLRPALCQILALITRRKHVRPFRIQTLLELRHNLGNEPPLDGLIRVYKDYYPDVVISEGLYGRASYFSHPNVEWRDHLLSIQAANAERYQGERRERSTFRVVRSGVKRSKVSTIPQVHTSQANEVSVTLEEIDGVNDFVQKIEKIEPPNQVVSVLRDPLLQRYLSLRPSDSALQRIENWLNTFFEDELHSIRQGQSDESQLAEVLQSLVNYTRYTKNLLSSCESFLRTYLREWNGSSNRDTILELASYLPMRPFNDVQSAFFDPIENALLDNTPTSQIILLEYYTSLLQQWTVQLLAKSNPSATPETPSQTLASLINYTSTLCLSLLESSSSPMNMPAPLSSTSPILSFYETICNLLNKRPSSSITINLTTTSPLPPAHLIYLLTFTFSLSNLSRVSSILAQHKTKTPSTYPPAAVNNLATNLHNLLFWPDRVLSNNSPDADIDANPLGHLAPLSFLAPLSAYIAHQQKLDPQPHLVSSAELFNLSHLPSLIALRATCQQEPHDDDKNNKRRSESESESEDGDRDRDRDRDGLLRFLEQRGVVGIGELMRSRGRVV